MKRALLLSVAFSLAALAAFAATHPDFSGTWEFNTSKSQHIGMMTSMKLRETIHQSDSSLDIVNHTSFGDQDQAQDNKTHYDLTGKPASNDSPMAGPSETVSQWQGDKLVTTWTSQNAIAGSKTVRTETRSLSADGNTMTLESVRGSNSSVVMVFDKKK